MTICGVDIPEYGDKICYNGEIKTCKGAHIYIGKNNKILSSRIHIGRGQFITIKVEDLEQ